MADAVAKAAGRPAAEVRRALMLNGDLARSPRRARRRPPRASRVRLQVGRPLAPMLAGTAAGLDAALEKIAPARGRLEARRRAHPGPPRRRRRRVFTRTLDDVTARLPRWSRSSRALPARASCSTARRSRARRRAPGAVPGHRLALRPRQARAVPLASLFFDVLHVDGEDLLDAPLARRTRPARVVPAEHRSRARSRRRRRRPGGIRRRARAGHEGVMVKALDAPYAAGRRGAAWLKVKPVHTLDLVVLAAEWGHGRRRGWLSNLHLGARDGRRRLGDARQDLQGPDRRAARVADRAAAGARRPHREGSSSTCGPSSSSRSRSTACSVARYPSGVALRFARVKRYREDKPAAEADTLATVRALRR